MHRDVKRVSLFHGRVISSTNERQVRIIRDSDGATSMAKIPSRLDEVVIGDFVSLVELGPNLTIEEVLPRRNCLVRSYRTRERKIIANVDRLFIVVAPTPRINPFFIDRSLAAARKSGMSCLLLVNKVDLGLGNISNILESYSALGLDLMRISSKTGQGMTHLIESLIDSRLRHAAFCGISGVGKSSILNMLVPTARQKVGELSRRICQGRQTTSQAMSFQMERPGATPLLITDLPGMNSFGISHLSRFDVLDSFPEFREFSGGCHYEDCWHMAEPICGVKEAVTSSALSATRYDSYTRMLGETPSREWERARDDKSTK